MVAKEITSLQHPIVKEMVKLRQERSFRLTKGCVFLSGIKLVEEVARIYPLKKLFLERGHFRHLRAEEVFHVTPEIFKKITGMPQPEPLAAVVSLPPPGDLQDKKFLLVLDRIADPGNLGTLLRTALALGWDGVFIVENSADPFNDKALRAAKGATFLLPLQIGTWKNLEELIGRKHFHVYLADIEGEPLGKVAFETPLMLILSSEAHGSRASAKNRFKRLSIPLNPSMESLNVAAAGAILLYSMRNHG